jgi:hypothetical protein
MTDPGRREPLRGRCHCGNVTVVFETALAPEELPLRACGCSFCARHGARAVSDPAGRVTIRVADPARVTRYRFALRTADFLACAECGVYVAAVLTDGPAAYATVNANVLEPWEAFRRAATAVSYDGETEEARRARRRAKWTPADVPTLAPR